MIEHGRGDAKGRLAVDDVVRQPAARQRLARESLLEAKARVVGVTRCRNLGHQKDEIGGIALDQVPAIGRELVADLIDKPANALSGGQEQRLGIARALSLHPSVLLLDEPTSALDPIATHNVEESLVNLRKKSNLTMIWVSHSIEQARRIGSRVLLLNAGKVVREDTVSAMLDPATGDKRALAFAEGDQAGLHNDG